MIKVSIIGSGNVAQHLIQAFQMNSQIEFVQVVDRDIKKVAHLLDSNRITSEYTQLQEADLYIIAVSDDAIAEVSSALPFKNRLVAHTSGTVALDSLNSNNRRAVFYPLQTFNKKDNVAIEKVPIFIEATNEVFQKQLIELAKTISNNVSIVNSEERKKYHLSAVFLNNFTNHLLYLSKKEADKNGLKWDNLLPLLEETFKKNLTNFGFIKKR